MTSDAHAEAQATSSRSIWTAASPEMPASIRYHWVLTRRCSNGALIRRIILEVPYSCRLLCEDARRKHLLPPCRVARVPSPMPYASAQSPRCRDAQTGACDSTKAHAFTVRQSCRFQQAELVHGRTAMVGVAGILIPDVRPAASFLAPPLAWCIEHGSVATHQ